MLHLYYIQATNKEVLKFEPNLSVPNYKHLLLYSPRWLEWQKVCPKFLFGYHTHFSKKQWQQYWHWKLFGLFIWDALMNTDLLRLCLMSIPVLIKWSWLNDDTCHNNLSNRCIPISAMYVLGLVSKFWVSIYVSMQYTCK